MAYTSTYRFARCSAQKARLVANMIRGLQIDQALTSLEFSKKRAAVMVRKTLDAAIGNATDVGQGNLDSADVRRLYVSEIRVDEGPTIKRFQPKDRGRAFPILKRTSHITVAVDVLPEG